MTRDKKKKLAMAIVAALSAAGLGTAALWDEARQIIQIIFGG